MDASKSVFISYKHEKDDKHKTDFVIGIRDKLKNDGYEVWFDEEQISAGDSLSDEIQKGISNSSIFLAFISKKYVESKNCKLEFNYAANINKPCIYVTLEKIDPSDAKGFDLYLNGDSIRHDAHKFIKNEDFDIDSSYRELKKSFEKINRGPSARNESTTEALKFDTIEIKRDEFFCGRDEILEKMKSTLKKNKFVCLTGMPGIGKTSCAAEYVYHEIDGNSVVNVFWLNADSKEKLSESICKHARKINVGDITDVEKSVKAFTDYLRKFENNLIVFDNVDDIEVVKKYFDLKTLKAKCIITTRQKIPNFTNIEVPPFTVETGRKYLKQILPHVSENDVEGIIQKIVEKNELLPYKISLIAGSLYENESLTIEQCLQQIDTGALIRRIIDELRGKNEGDSIKLLQCISMFDPDDIPWTLLREIKTTKAGREALQKIINKNLCKTVNKNTDKFGIRIHRLFQDDLIKIFNSTLNSELEKEIKDIFIRLFQKVDNNPDEKWINANRLFPHVEKFLRNARNNDLVTSQLYLNIGCYYFNVQHNYEKAKEFFEKALEITNKENPMHSLAGQSLNGIAASYSWLGDYKKCLEYHLKALEMRQKLYTGDHPDIAESLHGIGASYSWLGDYKKCLEYFSKSLEMRQKLYTGDHPDIAQSLDGIADSYSWLGDYKKCLEYHLKALEMRQKLYTGDHPDIAESLHGIGDSYSNLGDYKKCLEYHSKSLEMRQKLYTGDHPNIAESLHVIADSYSNLGDYNKGLESLLKALEMQRRLYNGNYPDSAQPLHNIADSYSNLGDYNKSLEYDLNALALRQKLYNGDHPAIAHSLHGIAISYLKLGDDDKSLEYATQSYKIMKKCYPREYPDVKMSLKFMNYLNRKNNCNVL